MAWGVKENPETKQTIDKELLAKEYLAHHPTTLDSIGNLWIWNHNIKRWEPKTDADLINIIVKESEIQESNFIFHHRAKIVQIIKDRSLLPEYAPKIPSLNLIQFGDLIYDLDTGKTQESSHKWFFTNILPYTPGNSSETPYIDKLIISWVGREYLDTIKELIAYSTYRGYPLHNIFCFVGIGRNGKSTFLRLLDQYLGHENVGTADLYLLEKNVFESMSLYKKLACVIQETEYGEMKSMRMLKLLSGEDKMSFQAK